MIRVALLACLVTLAACSEGGSDWAWGSSKDAKKTETTQQASEASGQITKAIFASSLLVNGSQADSIVDKILSSGRDGRALGEDAYQQVASEPALKRALAAGDDSQARHIVKERLCSLGLMSCDQPEAESKSHYGAPHGGHGGHIQPAEVFYAQPVAIKPIGQPIPAIPVRTPHAYKPFNGPIPPPGYNGYGRPQGPPGYGNGGPFNKPQHRPPPPPPIGGGFYGPPKPVPTYELEEYGQVGQKQSSHHKDALGSSAVHVHHHYHHGGAGGAAGGVNGPIGGGAGFIPNAGGAGGFLGGAGGAGGFLGSAGGAGGFLGNGGGAGVYPGFSKAPPPPVYEPDLEAEDPSFGGGYAGEYGSGSSFYKKELSLNKKQGSNNGNGLSSSYAGQYQGYESQRADNCYCVPLEQCPPNEVIGRKEDNSGLLIDPRNVASGIEAEISTDLPEASEPVKREDTPVVEEDEAKSNATTDAVRTKREADPADDDTKAQGVAAGARKGRNGKDSPDSVAEMEAGLLADEPSEAERSLHSDSDNVNTARDFDEQAGDAAEPQLRQFGNNYINSGNSGRCGPRQVCCRQPGRPASVYQQQQQQQQPPQQTGGYPQCGRRNAQGINGRIKNPTYVDGDSEFGEYPWQAAILKKDAHESVYVCGGTLIDSQHIITAAHCVKGYNGQELRVRLGEWDVNHDVEFYPYIETDVARMTIHPEFYAGTLINDLAILKMARPVDLQRNPHISPACLPDPHFDYAGSRCFTTGWGKDAFGDFGKYQNILKEVDVPVVSHHQCQSQLQQTRLGYSFKLHQGFVCAGGEEGKDACKGDGGGPMVCERGGSWQAVGVVSWGIGCGQYGVPGVYVKVANYLDWIRQTTRQFN